MNPILRKSQFNSNKNIYSQSNKLKLSIDNIKTSNMGVYKCAALNSADCVTLETSVKILPLPELKITSSYSTMTENSTYSLRCQVGTITGSSVDYKWLDQNRNVIQEVSLKFFVIFFEIY